MDSNGHNSGIATLLDLTNGQIHPISTTEGLSLGRSFECDVLIKDAYASRDHCFIYYKDGNYNIFDNYTRTGTFINCVKILQGKSNAVQLKHADCISFGRKTKLLHIFKFCLTDCEQPDSNTFMSNAEEVKRVLTESVEEVKTLKKEITLLKIYMDFELNQYNKMFDILSDLVSHMPILEGSTESLIHQRLYKEVGYFLDTNFTCILCKQIIIEAVTIQCNHIFCCYCLTTNLNTNSHCPTPGCGMPIYMIIRTRSIDNIIKSMIQQLGETIKQQRNDNLALRARHQPEQSDSDRPNNEPLEIIYPPHLMYPSQSALDANILSSRDFNQILSRLFNTDRIAYEELLHLQLLSQRLNRDSNEVVNPTNR